MLYNRSQNLFLYLKFCTLRSTALYSFPPTTILSSASMSSIFLHSHLSEIINIFFLWLASLISHYVPQLHTNVWSQMVGFPLFFGGFGVWTQGLLLHRQALYHVSHTPCPGVTDFSTILRLHYKPQVKGFWNVPKFENQLTVLLCQVDLL